MNLVLARQIDMQEETSLAETQGFLVMNTSAISQCHVGLVKWRCAREAQCTTGIFHKVLLIVLDHDVRFTMRNVEPLLRQRISIGIKRLSHQSK